MQGTPGELLYTGSVKQIFSVPGRRDRVRFEFSDRISVFDKWIPNTVPDKGEVLCRLAAFWFERAEAAGFHTHFIERAGPRTLIVRRIEVEHDYSRITAERRQVLVPCEFIVRHYVAGSFHDRMKAGALLGVARDRFAYGDRLPEPFCETSTKVEPTDRLISREEALAISKLTPGELDEIWAQCLRLDRLIEQQVGPGGLIHVDGKKEFARDAEGRLMLVDVFGTPDEDRWWDAEAHARGEIVQHSKELVRQHYRSIDFRDTLYRAREAGRPEPPIPPMPDEVVAQARALYVGLYERITGEAF